MFGNTRNTGNILIPNYRYSNTKYRQPYPYDTNCLIKCPILFTILLFLSWTQNWRSVHFDLPFFFFFAQHLRYGFEGFTNRTRMIFFSASSRNRDTRTGDNSSPYTPCILEPKAFWKSGRKCRAPRRTLLPVRKKPIYRAPLSINYYTTYIRLIRIYI